MAHSTAHRFSEDAGRMPWLAALLQAYAVLDAGVAEAVAATNRKPACNVGCHVCCRQPIPVSTLEVQGLRWFALTRLETRPGRVVGQALSSPAGRDCPFLVDGQCAAYAVRPMACREFVVFGRACAAGERPEVLRPKDVLALPAAAQRRAFSLLLPHYGIQEAEARDTALHDRLVLRDSRLLRDLDWSGLARALLCK
ncbi:YkgJ family cysteine cluster protein [Solidesulfovibrio sp.]